MSSTILNNSEALPPAADRFYKDYKLRDGVFDELMTPERNIRSHWQQFTSYLSASSDSDLTAAWAVAERMLQENGVTHNVHGTPNDRDRLWPFDPIPLIIPAAEWRSLEAGLIQRAQLLNAIVSDLYGPQRLLSDGLLPPGLVFGNSQFLRPVHGIQVPGDIHLHLVAFDLGRGPDGRWRVLSDRTQAPVGAGYSLENRITLSRTLAELYRSSPVQHVARFFQEFAAYLVDLARQDDPRVVLLTPGPTSETYFEHAYLARYLGIPLVETADLTVRDNRVYLKTLSGLNPVHMILRRNAGSAMDPLELGFAADGGIPGLIRAVRAGNVTLVNALGSGIVECDALQSYLPALCQQLLGDDLILPGVETLWCGEPACFERVRDEFDRLVIRDTFMSRSILNGQPHQNLPVEMAAAERTKLLDGIAANPAAYVGQEVISLSTAPTWQDGRFASRPVTLRVFVACGRNGYMVMPGGLTRTSDRTDPSAALLHQGDASKDTWILWDGPVDKFSRMAGVEQNQLPKRSAQDLPSRAADNLYWLGRYVERLESGARLKRSFLAYLSDDISDAGPDLQQRLSEFMVSQGHIRDEALPKNLQKFSSMDIDRLLTDTDPVNATANLIANVDRIANLVRERLSGDSWQILQDLHDIRRALGGTAANTPPNTPRRVATLSIAGGLLRMNQLIRLTAAFSGMQAENMTRSIGWRFLDIGRRLERAHMTSQLIAGCASSQRNMAQASSHQVRTAPLDDYDLELLLQLADSTMTYRTRYLSAPTPHLVVDMLLRDTSNPRSILFQLQEIQEHLSTFPRDSAHDGLREEQVVLKRLIAKIDLADLPHLTEPQNNNADATASNVTLSELFQTVEDDLDNFSGILQQFYFSHAEQVQKSGPIWIGN